MNTYVYIKSAKLDGHSDAHFRSLENTFPANKIMIRLCISFFRIHANLSSGVQKPLVIVWHYK